MKVMLALVPLLLLGCVGGGSTGSAEDQQRKKIGLLQKFDLWDLNGDGQLTEKELADGMRSHDVQIAETPAQIIEHYDRNGDRKVSMSEAQKG